MSERHGIDREEVLRIARLARLELDAAAVDRLAGELSAILEYVARLEDLDLDGVPPHEGAAARELRPDAVEASLDPGRTLASAPEQGDGLFKVPRVID